MRVGLKYHGGSALFGYIFCQCQFGGWSWWWMALGVLALIDFPGLVWRVRNK